MAGHRMPLLTRVRTVLIVGTLFVAAALAMALRSQAGLPVTAPHDQFGARIGDDYFLATYTQLEDYWRTLDRESDRMQLVDIGATEEGRHQWMAVISSPENLRGLDRYRTISRRLALAEGLTDTSARALAAEGRAVVWINGGLHADEVVGAQQLIQLVYELVSRSDAETLRILRDVVILVANANPDGHELVANWYMRESDPARRTLDTLPRSYQKYVGHDNNRDFYLSSQAETTNINRVLYRTWFPQIVYDHHQTAPPGTVMFAPPFRDPLNYFFDPLIASGIDLIGAAMHARFAAEGKAGVTMRGGSNYSTWWNGGLRTTAYFHNQIGLLTETIGGPTPTEIPFVPSRQLPTADLPHPVPPQRWHFRQSIDYSMTANRAVLDAASRYRETLLFNSYRMGRNAIDRGSRDSWTITPSRLARLGPVPPGARGLSPDAYAAQLSDPQLRDARGYIVPSDQPDFVTATKFVDALLKGGVQVLRAAATFTAHGRSYPAGSYVIKTAQAFRPHVLDMFEPQERPDQGTEHGDTIPPPYDNAGWTLAMQMGVRFHRLADDFHGPFEPVDRASAKGAAFTGVRSPAGYLVRHQNDTFAVANRLMAAGQQVFWLRDRTAGDDSSGTGSMYIPASSAARDLLTRSDRGLTFTGVAAPPPGGALRLRPVRVGLWDRYGGSSTSGWTRWVLEQFEFSFERVYAPVLDRGNLRVRYDVIVLPGEAVPGADSAAAMTSAGTDEGLPSEYGDTRGALSWTRTVPRLREFVEQGGTVIAIGAATVVAEYLGVRVGRHGESPAWEPAPAGDRTPDIYVPGSIMRVRVDNTTPLAYGFGEQADVFFDHSPVFTLPSPGAAARRVAWFDSAAPLRSGWARGQEHLRGSVAIVDASVGKGRVVLFGPEVIHRGQSHGTFKFLFNAIHGSRAEPVSRIPRQSVAR